MRVLVLAAHPDDETFGCGGAIARFPQAKHKVYVLWFGGGRVEGTQARKLDKVRKLLRIADARLMDFPDNEFDARPLIKLITSIDESITVWKPDLILTHTIHDANQDHREVHQATLVAMRVREGRPVPDVWAYSVAGSVMPEFQPRLFVPCGHEAKDAAMDCYADELHLLPYPTTREAIYDQMMVWGSQVGRACAEAFEVIRSVR